MIHVPKNVILDSSQSVFFQRELEQIEQRLFETKYPALEAERLLPNRLKLPEGVEKYTWRIVDGNAKAVPMAGHEDGAPLSDVNASEQSAGMKSIVSAYGYTVDEIAAANHAGMPLERMRADLARRILAEGLNYMALFGDSAMGIEGLLNLSNVLTYTTPNTGTGSSKKWVDKSADQILIDLFGMADAMADNTLDIEGAAGTPLNMLLTKANLRLIEKKRLTDSVSDTTVAEFFRKKRPNVTLIGANYLPTAGSGGTVSRQVCYDPSQVVWLGSVPFMQLPVEQKGFRFVTNCKARGGGVITPYPKSVVYGDDQ